MNKKRAILSSIILYVATFLVGIMIVYTTGVADPNNSSVTTIGLVTLALLTAIIALFYFRAEKPSTKEGFLLGLTILITGFVLDAVMTGLALLNNVPSKDIMSYYFSLSYLVGIVLVLIVPTGIAKILESTMRKV